MFSADCTLVLYNYMIGSGVVSVAAALTSLTWGVSSTKLFFCPLGYQHR